MSSRPLRFIQVDDESIDWKMFPRAAALAERLWSNPSEKWYKAERRILWQRLRSIRRGHAADVLQVLERLQPMRGRGSHHHRLLLSPSGVCTTEVNATGGGKAAPFRPSPTIGGRRRTSPKSLKGSSPKRKLRVVNRIPGKILDRRWLTAKVSCPQTRLYMMTCGGSCFTYFLFRSNTCRHFILHPGH